MIIDYSQPSFWAIVVSAVVFLVCIIASFVWPDLFSDDCSKSKEMTEADYLYLASAGYWIASVGFFIVFIAQVYLIIIGQPTN